MISVVVPIYNEEANLPELHRRLTEAAAGWGEGHELVFVDDGSSDRSFELMRAMTETDPNVRVVKLSRNFGHQPAVSAGIRHARGDAVLIIDGDLQDPPEVLVRFIEKWREGWDVVYAVRRKRKEGLFKRVAYSVFYRVLARVSDFHMPLDSGDFCLMDRRVVDTLVHELPEQERFVRGLRAYVGFRQVGLEYERDARAAGEAKYDFRALLKLAVSGMVSFSFMPLRLATYLGFLVAVPSFLMGVFFIVHRVFGFPVFGRYATDTPGLATLAVAVFFLSGVILIIMGILGEYIGRIYIEVKRRPGFIVDRVLGGDGPGRDRDDTTMARGNGHAAG